VHLRNLPTQSQVFDAGGTEKARTTYEYDNHAGDTNHAALTLRPSISGLCDGSTQNCPNNPNFTSTAHTTRGNATKVSRWLNTTGAILSSYILYDVAGNVVKTIDARGHATNLSYTDGFGGPDGNVHLNSPPFELSSVGQASYAFVTSATNAMGHLSFTQFDYHTGRPVNSEDANGIVSRAYSDGDWLDRPTKVVHAVNTSAQNQTTFAYDDPGRTITTSSDLHLSGDGVLVSRVIYDGLGRTTETQQYEGGTSYIATRQEYDPLGRVCRTSNPFRPAGFETPVWTTISFDALGRVISVTTPDNAAVSTSYSGNTVTVTDQAGKKRKSVTDGLGRLREVYEDPTPGPLNYLTSYDYDALGNLTNVIQGAQTRTFAYDSLSRLRSATNPEVSTPQGVPIPVTYLYDDNGNLLVKTDARGVSAHYDYDALNRITRRWYNGSSSTSATTHSSSLPNGVAATDEVTYAYDPNITNGKGRLASVSSSVSSYSFNEYDALGQVKAASQTIGAIGAQQTYPMHYTYDLAGHVKKMTYPSQRTVNYDYDAAGRTHSFIGELGGTDRNYSTGILYSALGGITREQFGTETTVYQKLAYNSRGQLAEIRASTNPTTDDWNRGKFVNWYGAGCGGANCNTTDNNGNLRKQETFIPHNDSVSLQSSWNQVFDYDNLNRLHSIQEGAMRQEYVYDRYGNRTIHQSQTVGAPKPNFGVDPNTNRLTVPAGYSMGYDNAGNLTNDTYTGEGQRTYDGENRMRQAWANGQWQTYTYDGDGRRVKRNLNGIETWQVYGVGGELLAEYAANASPASPQKEYGYRNGQLLITAVAGSGSQGPAQTYKASTDFSGIQGQANWYYLDSNGTPLTFLSQWGGVWNLPNTSVYLGGGWSHPGDPTDAVRQWRAPGAGSIHITGTAFDTDPGGGDGVIVSIRKGTQVLWERTIENGNGTGFSYDVTTSVAAGDQISFVTNRRSNTYWDSTSFDPAISYTSGGGVTAAEIKWMVTDQLGTPRMIIDKTGWLANVERHDYLPFGEELFAGTGGRSTARGYSSDTVRQKFTQKERDNETGLDYFLARYYSSTQGRFTSPDEFTGGPHDLSYFDDIAINPTFYAELAAPQSLNKYQYCLNNPLRFVDPDGHQPEAIAERLLNSPAGQQVITAAGAAATVTIVAASGAAQKAWTWFTTPNPNFKMNTFCSMGMDCSAHFRNQSNEQNSSANQGQQQQQGQGQSNAGSPSREQR
jgi:RHS repeat-associated protein